MEAEDLTTFTCLACRVGFSSSDAQRQHYKTDWHRYNLKRKIAGMIPVSADNFRERVAAQEREKQAQDKDKSGKKTKKNVRASPQAQQIDIRPPNATEPSVDAAIPEATETPTAAAPEPMEVEPIVLALEACIFCTHVATSFEESLKHMTAEHSFFIPDIEYIQDLEGLVRFLQSKVSEDLVCLCCNGKGKGFATLDAVRKHMVDKGHCMIDGSEDGFDEISEFYDFTSSYPDWEDVESGDEDKELTEDDINGAALSETGYELVLANGARAGHRALRRYFKQHFRPDDERDSVVTKRLLNSRRAIGGPSAAPLPKRERYERDRFVVRAQYMRQIISLRQNNLQFYFRQQVDV